jgi:RNA polymerase sigma factor (sigma-70 family)
VRVYVAVALTREPRGEVTGSVTSHASPGFLFDNNQKLAYSMANRMWGGPQSEYDLPELEQEALISLWRSSEAWDGRGKFSAFASQRMKWAILEYYRLRHPNRRSFTPVRVVSLEPKHTQWFDPRDQIEIRQLVTAMTAFNRDILEKYYVHGLLFREIGALYGMSGDWAAWKHRSILRKLRNLWFCPDLSTENPKNS